MSVICCLLDISDHMPCWKLMVPHTIILTSPPSPHFIHYVENLKYYNRGLGIGQILRKWSSVPQRKMVES